MGQPFTLIGARHATLQELTRTTNQVGVTPVRSVGDLFVRELADQLARVAVFAPGAPRKHYFEGFAQLADLSDEDRLEWFNKNDTFFVD
jgi:hypothetical protein